MYVWFDRTHAHTNTIRCVAVARAVFFEGKWNKNSERSHFHTLTHTKTQARAHIRTRATIPNRNQFVYTHAEKIGARNKQAEKEGNEGVEKKKEYERQSAKIKHRSHTKRTDRRGRRSNDAAEYTSTWCQSHTHHQRCRRCVMCVRYAVEWKEIAFIDECVVNVCCDQYTSTPEVATASTKKGLTHKWDGCSMRLAMPSSRICFEWKFVVTYSVSFAATEPTPLTLDDTMEPPPLSIAYSCTLHLAFIVLMQRRLCGSDYCALVHGFYFRRFFWKIGPTFSARSAGRCVTRSFGECTIANAIRIRISAAYLYACVWVTVEAMRKRDRAKEKDLVSAHSGIWCWVYGTDVGENEHMNRRCVVVSQCLISENRDERIHATHHRQEKISRNCVHEIYWMWLEEPLLLLLLIVRVKNYTRFRRKFTWVWVSALWACYT